MGTINLIYGGIDGTGEWGNEGYETTFENSHVNTLYKSWNEGPSYYKRGPVTGDNKMDCWTRLQAYRVFEFVTEHWRNSGKKAIFLAGYSRGGAAVIEVAKWLKDEKIPVECLILFDPVDRTGGVGLPWQNTPIANTVRQVIYARRSHLVSSRESFGNCGTEFEDRSKTALEYNVFQCTHGGMGGVPWTEPETGYIDEGFPDYLTNVTVEGDRLGAQKVQMWVWGLLFEMISSCKQRLAQEGQTTPHPDFQIPNQHNAPHLGGKQRIHIVKPGDWLSKIAQQYYGDMNKWKFLYYDVPGNKEEIGPDYNLIKPGQRIIVPYI